MSELTPQLAEQVIAACQANAGELAGALSRTLDASITVTVGEAGSLASDDLPAGPGLAALFTFGGVGFVAILAEESGLVPAWCEYPDATGSSKLSTLAQELSMLLVPDSLMADDFSAARVADVRVALQRAGATEGAVFVPLELKAGEKVARLELVWPLTAPANLFDAAKSAEVAPVVQQPQPSRQSARSFAELPSYSRSLLKISVPVRVVLAMKKESVQDVVELAAGTIIKFSKSCDEELHLYVGDQQVAEGEAVKVGDKFGFRVTGMTLPEEHFLKLRTNRAS